MNTPNTPDMTKLPVKAGQVFEDLPQSDQKLIELMSAGIGYVETAKQMGLESLTVIRRFQTLKNKIIYPAARLAASDFVNKLAGVMEDGLAAVDKHGMPDHRVRLQCFKTFNEQCGGVFADMLTKEVRKQNPVTIDLTQPGTEVSTVETKRTILVIEELEVRLKQTLIAEEQVDLTEYVGTRNE